MPRAVSLSYYPWITQSIGGPQLAKAIQDFAKLLNPLLSDALGETVSVAVLPEMNVIDQIHAISTDPTAPTEIKIALMNPVGYALAHERAPGVQSIAIVRRRIGAGPAGPTYRSQIYTNILTGIKALSELRGRTFAFGSPQSTSNFVVPANMLWKAGLHPVNCFSRLEFAGGHDTVAKAVYEGRVDAGAGHDGVISDLAGRTGYSNAEDRLLRIQWSEPLPSDPIAANTLDKKGQTALTAALLKLAPKDDSTAPGNLAISKFWSSVEGLEPISSDSYRPLLQLMSDLSLRPDDVITK